MLCIWDKFLKCFSEPTGFFVGGQYLRGRSVNFNQQCKSYSFPQKKMLIFCSVSFSSWIKMVCQPSTGTLLCVFWDIYLLGLLSIHCTGNGFHRQVSRLINRVVQNYCLTEFSAEKSCLNNIFFTQNFFISCLDGQWPWNPKCRSTVKGWDLQKHSRRAARLKVLIGTNQDNRQLSLKLLLH